MANDSTYYAWSPIHYHTGEGDSLEKKIAKPGDTVTQNELDVDDEEWATLLEGGSVRNTKYPKGVVQSGMSPNEHRLNILRKEREKLEAEIAGVGGTPGDTEPSATNDSSTTTSSGATA